MKLLVTNDDGWGAPGINALEAVARKFGDVTIAAPLRPQSGISHQLTLARSMALVTKGESSFALDGTPADCTRYAISQLGISFDWVLSGINNGSNVGVDVYVSGTVAAAREATLHGVNAIAFSQHRKRFSDPDFDWLTAQKMCEEFLNRALHYPAPNTVPATESHAICHWPRSQAHISNKYLINVNLPDLERASIPAEFVNCELDPSPLPTDYKRVGDEVRFSGRYHDRERRIDGDIDVSFSGRVAVTYL